MIKRTYSQIAAMCEGIASSDISIIDMQISGVSKDTRTIQLGNLYVPLIGESFDGHRFVEEAVSQGAVASLWQNDHEHPPAGVPLIFVDDTLAALQTLAKSYLSQLNVRIVGITGSNGKTTTKDMTASVLATTYKVHKTIGNYNNHIGLPFTLLQLEEDTEIVVLEMGMSNRGEIQFLSELAEPEIAIITNIGEAHLLQLGTREEIARAKTEIVAGLQTGGTLIYNGDDPLIEAVLPEWAQHRGAEQGLDFNTVTFGTRPENDFTPERVLMDATGTHFQISGLDIDFYIPVLGSHNVVNALAALAVGMYFDIPHAVIAEGLRASVMTGMRIELTKTPLGLTVLNDAYNASPSSMKAALHLLQELQGYTHKIVVLGDMLELGEREVEFHREIGQMLDPNKIDRVFTYGTLTKHVAEQAARVYNPEGVTHFDDKSQLAQAIANYATPNDVVLVKGSRGMKLEQIVAKLTLPNPPL
jgi:UDP-N-acetylmuramoyl-tripeptide--D-alanyl-D-alanine ligase